MLQTSLTLAIMSQTSAVGYNAPDLGMSGYNWRVLAASAGLARLPRPPDIRGEQPTQIIIFSLLRLSGFMYILPCCSPGVPLPPTLPLGSHPRNLEKRLARPQRKREIEGLNTRVLRLFGLNI